MCGSPPLVVFTVPGWKMFNWRQRVCGCNTLRMVMVQRRRNGRGPPAPSPPLPPLGSQLVASACRCVVTLSSHVCVPLLSAVFCQRLLAEADADGEFRWRRELRGLIDVESLVQHVTHPPMDGSSSENIASLLRRLTFPLPWPGMTHFVWLSGH